MKGAKRTMFIRVLKKKENGEHEEWLFNVNHISKIQVYYTSQADDGTTCVTDVRTGGSDPFTTRCYRVYVAGEVLNLRGSPGDPVMDVIEQIFKDAVKGGGKSRSRTKGDAEAPEAPSSDSPAPTSE